MYCDLSASLHNLTFEPIWLPHCPACKWIISRILYIDVSSQKLQQILMANFQTIRESDRNCRNTKFIRTYNTHSQTRDIDIQNWNKKKQEQ